MKLKYYLRGLGIGIIVTAIIMTFTRQPEKLTDAQIKLRALELGMVEKSVLADLEKEDIAEADKQGSNLLLEENSSVNEKEDISIEDSSVVSEKAESNSASEKENTSLEDSSAASEKEESNSASEKENTSLEDSSAVSEKENISLGNSDSMKEEEVESKNWTDNDISTKNNIRNEENREEIQNNTVVQSGNTSAELTQDSSLNIPETEVVENFVMIYLESGYGSEYASKKVYDAGLVESSIELNRYLVRNGYDRKLRAGYHEIPVGASMEEIARIMCRME